MKKPGGLLGIPVLILSLAVTLAPSLPQAAGDGRITVHAAGRGRPWISLSDGVDLPAASLPGASARARRLALAAGDFDGDGVPDLASSSAGSRGGRVALHRGNVDAIYPQSPEARRRRAQGTFTEAPFLPLPRGFAVPEAPAFLAAGDFDADGHLDVVTAAAGSPALYWLRGDGQGGLGPAQRIKLSGAVTALAAGEINRADGLTDLVVGITGREGPQVLLFEGPEGALRHEPEALPLPGEAAALALGRLDGDPWRDLAIAAGSDLLIVSGRDRRLSLDETLRGDVSSAAVETLALAAPISALAVGSFTDAHATELAALGADGTVYVIRHRAAAGSPPAWAGELLTAGPWAGARQLVRARLSTGPRDDLVVVDPANRQLHLLPGLSGPPGTPKGLPVLPVALDVEGSPVAVLPMRLNRDALSDLVVLRQGSAAPTVVLTESPATFVVNSTGDEPDASPGNGVCATSAGACTLRAAIEEANRLAGADTIAFSIGIGTGAPTIAPTSALPSITDSLTIDGTTQPGFAGTPIIELDLTQNGGLGALLIEASSTAVRGLVINRSAHQGIFVLYGDDNIIEGNFIGTDVSGTAVRGNATEGVHIESSANNVIGGTAAPARNVISGNGRSGILISGNSTSNVVQGNFIGVDATGTAALGNASDGMLISDEGGDTIGGMTAGARNVISGNGGSGIFMSSPYGGNLIQGNFIGIDAANARAGNTYDGIDVGAPVTTIGGAAAGARNIISDNGMNGVRIRASFNEVQDNVLTLNGGDGIYVQSGTGNLISVNFMFGNSGLGIDLSPDGVTPNDPGDGDTGANDLQNFPVLTSAVSGPARTAIQGILNSTPNRNFALRFFSNAGCDPSGYGEGETFLGAVTVTTNASGNATFYATLDGEVPAGRFITATATDSSNNTSEFSRCLRVTAAPVITALSPASGPVGTRVTLTGAGFTPTGNTVRFGQGYLTGLPATNAGTRLRFTVPAGVGLCPRGSAPCAAGVLPVRPGPFSVSVLNADAKSNGVMFTVTGK